MNKKEKPRFMKRIVLHCMAMLTGCTIASYIFAAFDIDTTPILTLVYGGFGGELLLTVVLRLVGEERLPATAEGQAEKKNNNSNG